jgi:curved DNA-binding protein
VGGGARRHLRVPTLDGSAKVRVPAGSPSGRRLRGQGFLGRNGPGNLYAAVTIAVRRELSADERALFE